MTGKPINLRQARKRKARAGKRARGDANAALHGVSKVQTTLARARLDKARRGLDGHRRDLPAEDAEPAPSAGQGQDSGGPNCGEPGRGGPREGGTAGDDTPANRMPADRTPGDPDA